MARPGFTRIRQELKSTPQGGLKAGPSPFCIPRADLYHPSPRALPVGWGHSLAKGEVAVEPLRKLGDPGTPRPVTPGAP